MILVGTSGYSYPDWRGVLYPEDMRPDGFLAAYAERFPAVEINTTYYGIPKPAVFEHMVSQTHDGFEFIVKANRATTHESADSDVAKEFDESLRPLGVARRLSGILAQFPWGFRNTETNRRYLAELAGRYEEIPYYIEFRHNSWNRDEIYAFLEKLGLGFVSVDEPQIGDMMPPVVRATGDVGYVRFHGRNEKTWWSDSGDRYDYEYTGEELKEWYKRIQELSAKVRKLFVFFNNCHLGVAAKNALMFKDLVTEGEKPS